MLLRQLGQWPLGSTSSTFPGSPPKFFVVAWGWESLGMRQRRSDKLTDIDGFPHHASLENGPTVGQFPCQLLAPTGSALSTNYINHKAGAPYIVGIQIAWTAA